MRQVEEVLPEVLCRSFILSVYPLFLLAPLYEVTLFLRISMLFTNTDKKQKYMKLFQWESLFSLQW